jgi:RimJ/RimL family protein N-acetyltransferase
MSPVNSRVDVSLTPLTIEHVPRMFEWMLDPSIAENLGLRRLPSLAATESWVTNAQTDPTVRALAIHFEQRHVGNVVLDRIDDYLQSARLSVYIGDQAARGRGVGTAAVRLACERGFKDLNLNKIWLTVHSRNGAAIASYTRCGFAVEGVHREEFLLRGERLSAIYMGLLRAEAPLVGVAW